MRPQRRMLRVVLLGVGLALPFSAAGQSESEELQRCFQELGLVEVDTAMPVEAPTVGPYYGLRLMGMGGAFSAIAEGAESMPYTLAALSNRRPDQEGWFDWDWTASLLLPARVLDMDYNGCGTRDRVNLLALGLLLRFGRHGFGVFVDRLGFPPPRGIDRTLAVLRTTAGTAWAMPGDDFVLAVGLHSLVYELRDASLGDVGGVAFAPGFDLLWRPKWKNWRMGVAFRLPATAPLDGSGLMPTALAQPWQLTAGAAWWVGDGQLNQPIPNHEDDPGNPPAVVGLLVSLDLVLTGVSEVKGAPSVGLEAYSEGWVQPTEAAATVGVRLGAETEAIPGRVRMRGGYWIEPSRFAGITPRLHWTGGLDVFLFPLWQYDIRASLAFDVAVDYSVFSLSVGFW